MKSTGISRDEPAEPQASDTPPPLPRLMSWDELAGHWPHLSTALRRELARSGGHTVHSLWAGRADLLRLPPACWTAEINGLQARLHPPEALRVTLPIRLTIAQVLSVLSSWHESGRTFASTREQIAFLRAFLAGEAVDPAGFRYTVREIATMSRRSAQRLAAAACRYHRHQRRRGRGASGFWAEPSVSPDELRDALDRAADDPASTVIKRSPGTLTFRASVLGRDCLVKRYDLAGTARRIRYWFRASRGRRAWAAACTLRDLGLATPMPLGYVDVGRSRSPARSYFVTAFLPDAVTVRDWIRRRYRGLLPDERQRFRRQLAAFWIEIHRRGVYHADTKTLNMLLLHPDDEARRQLLWIDLDGVQPGAEPTRRRVLRNLVQLNGSVRSWVPEEDRLDFLEEAARDYPWLRRPSIVPHLRAWTRRRLLKEVRLRCGP